MGLVWMGLEGASSPLALFFALLSSSFPSILPLSPMKKATRAIFSKNGGEAKPGGFQTRVFPTDLSGKVQIVSRTLSGLFLVGALNRPRKRKRTNRENPRTIPEQIGKIPEKSGKSQKGQKRKKKEGHVQIGKPPRLKPPRLAALEIWHCQSQIARTPASRRQKGLGSAIAARNRHR